MNSQIAPSNVITTFLSYEDLNPALIDDVLKDCRDAGEFTSYLTNSVLIFKQPELVREEFCVILAFPGILSENLRPTVDMPMPCTRWRASKVTPYLMLRDDQIYINTYGIPIWPESHFHFLYLFDDRPTLDTIPLTEGLQHDIAMQHMHSQSSVPYDSPVYEGPRPIIINRCLEIKPASNASHS